MEFISKSAMRKNERDRLESFSDVLDEYVADVRAVLSSFWDYHAVMTELLRLYRMRFKDDMDSVFWIERSLGSVVFLIQDLEVEVDKSQRIYVLNEDGTSDDEVRFSENDLHLVYDFGKNSSEVFDAVMQLIDLGSDFAHDAEFGLDCAISLLGHRIPYFARKMTSYTRYAADRFAEVYRLLNMLADDIKRQDKRLGGYNADDIYLDQRKAELEQRVRNMNAPKEEEQPLVSDIMTIVFPASLFGVTTQENGDFYIVPFGEDDYILIPVNRVKPSRSGSGDMVVACRRSDADEPMFETTAGYSIDFNKLSSIIWRISDERGL